MKKPKAKPPLDFTKPITTDVWISGYPADVYVCEGEGGSFTFPHDGLLKAQVVIGIGARQFWKTRRTVFHELFEAQATNMRLRFQPTNTLQEDSSDGALFIITHAELTEIIAWVSDAWDVVEQAVLKAWRQYHRQQKEAKTK